ncbi:glycoside hydrolase superfamily, partial [Polychytrium aggregatum]|uniref:glycoside hydrolase superfamily n=1 Tax=Polychytrium aggregatum TaxID=110093 RepID=UPI0022FE66E9
YNTFILGFWLSSGAYDSAYTWTGLDASVRQGYLDSLHAAGKVVLVAAFGAAEFPTLSKLDPVKTAQNLAAFVKQYQLDGADIDWEDNPSLEAGTGEAWLISFQTELRNNLPSPRYIITHAPQAPYFVGKDLPTQYPNGGYLTVDQKVGSTIDWYNIQFYNQGSTNYQDCTSLLNKSQAPFIGTSVFEIIAKGVPSEKVVIGKPITQADVVNTGFMSASTLASCISQAKATGKWNAGFFGWQITHDTSGWSNTVAAGL